MSSRPSVRSVTLLGLALGGLLVGHAVTYRLLVPDAHARTAELAETGHAYLAGANALGLFAAIAALSVLFLGRLVRTQGNVPHAFWRLAAFQLTAFAAMEVLERLGSGAGVRGLLPTMVVGVPVQILVASVVTVVVRFIVRAATIVADRAARGAASWSFGAIAPIVSRVAAPPLAPATGVPPGRAPPFVR
jgi:hypothetical protein